MNSMLETAVQAPAAESAPDTVRWLRDKAPVLLDWIISTGLVATIIVGTTWVVFFGG